MQPDSFLKLKPREIEKAFNQVVHDLHWILVLDGIDQLPDGFRIRSHDLYGPLPKILVEDRQDRYPLLDAIEREAGKMCAIVRARKDLSAPFPGCEFLPAYED